jgi:hypothetical protein
VSEVPGSSRFAGLLRDLTSWCAAEGVPVVVIGGVAASLQARPRLTRDVEGALVPLARPEDLIITKLVAGRARDREDIEGLLDTTPDLDRGYVREWISQFAEVLEAPELLEEVDRQFRRRP